MDQRSVCHPRERPHTLHAPQHRRRAAEVGDGEQHRGEPPDPVGAHHSSDRKSTRLNSSHSQISYAVFCLKKKKKKKGKNPCNMFTQWSRATRSIRHELC